jgi:phage-related protein
VCNFDPPDSTAGTMYIDCEKMIAYNLQNGENINQTPCTAGKFPFLAPGNNLLSAYNDAQQPTTLSVIGNWRDY